jgi:hypothetical protein
MKRLGVYGRNPIGEADVQRKIERLQRTELAAELCSKARCSTSVRP